MSMRKKRNREQTPKQLNPEAKAEEVNLKPGSFSGAWLFY
ncbi:hypothetical protein KPP_1601 [Klebsiella phage KPP-1]|nr:hypothetical protein KPP_1601 [Klebsiella phage KPP-1]